jgi:hypothetical protein
MSSWPEFIKSRSRCVVKIASVSKRLRQPKWKGRKVGMDTNPRGSDSGTAGTGRELTVNLERSPEWAFAAAKTQGRERTGT